MTTPTSPPPEDDPPYVRDWYNQAMKMTSHPANDEENDDEDDDENEETEETDENEDDQASPVSDDVDDEYEDGETDQVEDAGAGVVADAERRVATTNLRDFAPPQRLSEEDANSAVFVGGTTELVKRQRSSSLGGTRRRCAWRRCTVTHMLMVLPFWAWVRLFSRLMVTLGFVLAAIFVDPKAVWSGVEAWRWMAFAALIAGSWDFSFFICIAPVLMMSRKIAEDGPDWSRTSYYFFDALAPYTRVFLASVIWLLTWAFMILFPPNNDYYAKVNEYTTRTFGIITLFAFLNGIAALGKEYTESTFERSTHWPDVENILKSEYFIWRLLGVFPADVVSAFVLAGPNSTKNDPKILRHCTRYISKQHITGFGGSSMDEIYEVRDATEAAELGDIIFKALKWDSEKQEEEFNFADHFLAMQTKHYYETRKVQKAYGFMIRGRSRMQHSMTFGRGVDEYFSVPDATNLITTPEEDLAAAVTAANKVKPATKIAMTPMSVIPKGDEQAKLSSSVVELGQHVSFVDPLVPVAAPAAPAAPIVESSAAGTPYVPPLAATKLSQTTETNKQTHKKRRRKRVYFERLQNAYQSTMGPLPPYAPDSVYGWSRIIDPGKRGYGTVESFRASIYRFYQHRTNVAASLRDAHMAVERLGHVLFALAYVLGAVLGALIFAGPSSYEVWLGIISFFLAFAVVFGSMLSTIFENIVFLFGRHTLDVGDLIVIEGDYYSVRRLELLSTLIIRWSGEFRIVENSWLAKQAVLNLTRSGLYWHTVESAVDISTCTSEFIQRMRACIKTYVDKHEDSFSGEFQLCMSRMERPLHVVLSLWIEFAYTPTNLSRLFDDISKANEAMCIALRNNNATSSGVGLGSMYLGAAPPAQVKFPFVVPSAVFQSGGGLNMPGVPAFSTQGLC